MQMDPGTAGHKRKRSLSDEPQDKDAPPTKSSRNASRLHINYLARQQQEDIPLVTRDDPLPAILRALTEYSSVLDRHESLASNLGIRVMGSVLMKRFERMFERPPHVLSAEGKNAPPVSWLDVVNFAEQHPEQFTLNKESEGVRSCEITVGRSLVSVSEEDFMLINSGMPRNLIPPQPIVEDEEKELGTLQILEDYVAQILGLADQVATRARQLSHQMKARKTGIIDRRAAKTAVSGASILRTASPSNVALVNGGGAASTSPMQSPTSFLTSVNRANADTSMLSEPDDRQSNPAFISPELRDALLKQFTTLNSPTTTRSNGMARPNIPATSPTATPQTPHHPDMSYTTPTTSTPYAPLASAPKPRSTPAATKDNDGPHKAEMVLRVERLPKGAPITPPCDRCRRLGIACTKNLTACMGCTRKHAKCTWRDVSDAELRGGGGMFDASPQLAAQGEAANFFQQHPEFAGEAHEGRAAAPGIAAAAMGRQGAGQFDAEVQQQQQQPSQMHHGQGEAVRHEGMARGPYDSSGPEALLLLHQQQQQQQQHHGGQAQMQQQREDESMTM